ncbi:MAG: cysteine desulfurase [Flavobacteria bacterium RIFCSPLOWO2_12_FULL_35_11]|nr:MAG: cysteine desulfurase [Flavobacteria bacterium RIFCSPLOWO2_12_FULL_35_11]
MKTIYLDNAATTPLLPEVIDAISSALANVYGNPSSIHHVGRKAKSLVETSRKNIAKHFNASSQEIIFTAGGSEADNLILRNAVTNLGVTTIISSKIEHHAVLHTMEHLRNEFDIVVNYVDLDESGTVNYAHLEQLLQVSDEKKLVSLMYVNNEIGNVLNLEKVSELCIANNALFHSDTVQGIGHFNIDVKQTPIDFFVASAHKFHGPKGVGFAYIKRGFGIHPILHGGEQERGARAGTENVHSILGMEKALEISCTNMKKESAYIQKLKNYFIDELKQNFEGIEFNGQSESETESSYTILNVRFPKEYAMLLFNLDLKGIAVSGGSACQSGSNMGSHVLHEILPEKEAIKTSVRFSFSKFNNIEELDYVVSSLKKLIN